MRGIKAKHIRRACKKVTQGWPLVSYTNPSYLDQDKPIPRKLGACTRRHIQFAKRADKKPHWLGTLIWNDYKQGLKV